MRKHIKKVIGLMLVIFASCFCGLTGCKGKYDDMKLELSTKSIQLVLDGEDENLNGTGEFTATVSGVGEDVSREVVWQASSPDVLNISQSAVNENGQTKFTISANSVIETPVILTIQTQEGDVKQEIEVTATKALKSISYNSSYKQNAYVVVGEEKVINTSQAIKFFPEDSNLKNITYTIKNLNGHEAEITNDRLLITRKSDTSSTIVITATSDQPGVDPVDIEFKVVEPISLDKISVTEQDGTEVSDEYIFSVANLLAGESKLKINVDTLENIEINAEILGDTNILKSSIKDINTYSEVTLNTTGYTGENTLRISVKIKDFNYTTTRDILIKVEKLPSQIFVNNEDISQLTYKEYDIYNSYKNPLGQKFEIKIGDELASDKRFTLFVEEDQRKNIRVIYADGREVDLTGTTILQTSAIIYVQATEDYDAESSPKLLIKTISGKETQQISAELAFALKTSAKSINITAYGEEENVIFLEKNQPVKLVYTLDNDKAYINGLTVQGYDKSILNVDIDQSTQHPTITLTAKNFGANSNMTSFKVVLPNGYESEFVYVYPYISAGNVHVTAPKLTDEYGESIANSTYNSGDISSIILAKDGYTKLNVTAKANDNSYATIFSQTLELVNNEDRNYIRVNNEGYIYARSVKTNDDGKVAVKAIVQTLQPKFNADGICTGEMETVTKEVEFTVQVFVQISKITLDKQFVDIYYSNDLWYENDILSDINKATINLSILASNAIPDKIEWQLSNSESLSLQLSNDDKTCTIVAGDGTGNRNITLTVFVTQQNKVFSKTVYISLKTIQKPTNLVIDGVRYSKDSNQITALAKGDSGYYVGGLMVYAKELYFDSRTLTENTFAQIVAHVTSNANGIMPTNSNVCYEIVNGKNYISISNDGKIQFKTDEDGNILSGVVLVKIYAQGSKYQRYSEPQVAQYLKITIADGTSLDTAFEISNETTFFDMLKDTNVDKHYYVVKGDIYLTKSLENSGVTLQGKAPRYLASAGDKNYTIYNLQTSKTYALFNEIGESSVIANLNFNVTATLNNLENENNIGLLSQTNSGRIINVNINLVACNITLNANSSLTFGVFAGENKGTIQNSSVTGNINISGNENVSQIYVGGFAGINNGTISGNNENFATQNSATTNFIGNITIDITAKKQSAVGLIAGVNYNSVKDVRVDNSSLYAPNLNNVGGLVGNNNTLPENNITATLINNYVNAIVKGNNNIGGLVGQNNSGEISQNIVELYETDDIFADTSEKFYIIQGTENIGGLIGLVSDADAISTISNNYVRNYASKIYIQGTENVGGLAGQVNGKTNNDETTSINTNFAYTNIQGTTNVGGLIGYAKNVVITNVYSRGTISANENETLSSAGELVGTGKNYTLTYAYSTIQLATSSNNDETNNDETNNVYYNNVYYPKSATELAGISVFTTSPWTVNTSYNDGYPILTLNESIMEKLIAQTLSVEIKDNYKDNSSILIKYNDNSTYTLSSIITIKDENGNKVNFNDVIFASSDKTIFEIDNSNNIVFKSYGKAKLSITYKYNRSLAQQIDIIFVHDVAGFGLSETQNHQALKEISIRKTASKSLFAFAESSDGTILSSNNIFVKVQVAPTYTDKNSNEYIFDNSILDPIFKFNGYDFIEVTEKDGDADKIVAYVCYLPLGEVVLNTFEKFETQLTLSIVEKVGDNYITVSTTETSSSSEENSKNNQNNTITLSIFNGVSSISIDKTSVNLTTMNEIEFVVTVIADTNELSLSATEVVTEDDNNKYIKIETNEPNGYVLILNCNSEYVDNGDGTYTHTFTHVLRMRDEYLLLNNQRMELAEGFNTNLTFTTNLSTDYKAELEITVEPQDLLKITTVHFPNGKETKDGDQVVFYPNELPSNTITPGEFGMLMIDIYPEYAYYDTIEVYYETTGDCKMTFVQTALASVSGTSKYVEVKPSALYYNEKIVLSRLSEVVIDANESVTSQSFTGRYYVKTLIPTATKAGTQYSIKVRAIRYDSEGEVVQMLESKPLVIEALPRPSVELETDANDSQKDGNVTYIARGTSQNIFATTENYTKYADFVLEYTFPEGEQYVENADTNIYKIPYITQSGNSVSLYVPLSVPAGTEITVSATVSRFLNGIEYPDTKSVTFMVTDFVVTGISTDQNENTMNVVVGQDKTVSLKLETLSADETNTELVEWQNNLTKYTNLLNTYLSLEVTKEIEDLIKYYTSQITQAKAVISALNGFISEINGKIDDANKEVSKLNSGAWKWYISKDESVSMNGDNEKFSFGSTSEGDPSSPFYYISLKNNNDNSSCLTIHGLQTSDTPISNIKIDLGYHYENGIFTIGELESNTDTKSTIYNVNCGLDVYVVTSATVDNPTPIYTIEQFLSMGDEDYILMNDLYLTTQDGYFTESYSADKVEKLTGAYNLYYYDENSRFTSIVPEFKSLDGNGYKIYINSFALTTNTSNDFGLFTNIGEDVMVRNLEVVYLPQVVATTKTDETLTDNKQLNISAEGITSANFGLFAGQNQGIITNCNVSFRTFEINTSNGTTTITLLNDDNKVDSSNNQFTIKLDETINATFGGFVGVNKGYITNSKVGGVDFSDSSADDLNRVLIVQASGVIGGFVGENQYKISTSYAYNIGVENLSSDVQDTTTAGFVGLNTTNGIIIESYAEGRQCFSEDKEDTKETYNASKMPNYVSSLGNVGGFVHTNNGVIKDSYSNLPIKTPSRSAGFVYINSGNSATISECYSMCVSKDQSDSQAFRYFTGTDTKSQVNNLNGATITHAFYMLDSEVVETDERFKEPASNIASKYFTDGTYFYGFEINANIWQFSQDNGRPILAQTQAITKSQRFVTGIEMSDGHVTGYTYSYSSNTTLGSNINPVIIYNAESFLKAFTGEELQQKKDGKYQYNYGSLRLVCDIDLADYRGSEELSKLQNINFAGSLDGNGFELQNVGILGYVVKEDTTNGTEQGTNKNTETQTLKTTSTSSESFGLFEKITGQVKNLTINVVEMAQSDSQKVGVLAGEIVGGAVVNVNINGEGVTVEGKNMVGGLAGYVGSDSTLSNITTNVSVTATYSTYNDNSKYRDGTISTYGNGNSTVSYAGGIAGVIELNSDSNIFEFKKVNETEKVDSLNQSADFNKASRLRVQGEITISGEIVGGIAGYLGIGSSIYDTKFEICDNQSLIGKYAVGGLVGENHGKIETSRIEVSEDDFEAIDEEFDNNSSLTLFESDTTSPKYVGGLVGFMPVGGIVNSYSKANVIHKNAMYIGGIAGSIGAAIDENKITALQNLLSNAQYKLNEQTYYMLVGTVVDKVYTTGLVYTNPNYKYSDGTKEYDDSVITDGTILADITATPQNKVGGLYGNAYVQMSGENLLNQIFQNIVANNNWRTSISGYSNVVNVMNGYNENRKDENGENIVNNQTIYKTTYEANTGYFAGDVTFKDVNKDILISQYATKLYLNNFIGNKDKNNNTLTYQIINPTGLTENQNLFKFSYDNNYMKNKVVYDENDQNKGTEIAYSNIKTNLRNEYRTNEERAIAYYENFSATVWDKVSYTYPKLFENPAEQVKYIRTEEDLFEMANTSGVATTYYLMNDIVLTKNWNPIKGFKGKFLSAEGGPYTIYNININTSNDNNVGFFASMEDALVSNINFVFGGRLQPATTTNGAYDFETDTNGKSTGKIKWECDKDGNALDMETWDTTNGLYPFTSATIGEDNKQYFESSKFDTLTTKLDDGTEQTIEYTQGGIKVSLNSSNDASTNISALAGVNYGSSIYGVNIQFAEDSNIQVVDTSDLKSTTNNFGLISAFVGIEDAQIVVISNVEISTSVRPTVKIEDTNSDPDGYATEVLAETNNETSANLTINLNYLNSSPQFFNYGAGVGLISNSKLSNNVSVKSVTTNSNLKIKTIITLENFTNLPDNTTINPSVSVGGMFGYINNAVISSVTLDAENTITLDSGKADLVNIGGFAGEIKSGTTITNPKISKVDITASNTQTINKEQENNDESKIFNFGGLVGKAQNLTATQVSSSAVSAQTETSNSEINTSFGFGENDQWDKFNLGGLVGNSISSTFTDISSTCNINSTNASTNAYYIGGAVGSSEKSTFKGCYADGEITFAATTTATGAVGGFAGLIGEIESSTQQDGETQKIKQKSTETTNQYKYSLCVGNANITCDDTTITHVGGFAGYVNESGTALSNCLSYGRITCTIGEVTNKTNSIGGFVGYHSGASITDCLSMATIFTDKVIDDNKASTSYVGGFAGFTSNDKNLTTTNNAYAYELAGVSHNGNGLRVYYEGKYKNYKYYGKTLNLYGFVIEHAALNNIKSEKNDLYLKLNPYNISIFMNLESTGSKLAPIYVTNNNFKTIDWENNSNVTYLITNNITLSETILTSITLPENVIIINPFNDTLSRTITISIAGTSSLFESIGTNTLVSGLIVNYTGVSVYAGNAINANISTWDINNDGIYPYTDINDYNNDSVKTSGFAGIAGTNNGHIFFGSVLGSVVLNKDSFTATGGYPTANKSYNFATAVVGLNTGKISHTSSNLIIDANNLAKHINIAGFALQNENIIAYCYANGEINNTDNLLSGTYVNGFVGRLLKGNNISSSYSATTFTVNNKNIVVNDFIAKGSSYTGNYVDKLAITVKNSAIYRNNYGDTKRATSNILVPTTEQEQTSSNFSNQNFWIFDDAYNYGYPMLVKYVTDTVTKTGSGNNTTITIANTYIVPETAVKNTGDGTEDNPYQIHHAGRLDWIRTRSMSSKTYFKQTRDIDMSQITNFATIGGSSSYISYVGTTQSTKLFSANSSIKCENMAYMVYNGGNHVIYNLKMTNPSHYTYVALFANAYSVSNLGVENTISLSGSNTYSYVGGIVAYATSVSRTLIDNCFAKVDITISGSANVQYVGGLVGVCESIDGNAIGWNNGGFNQTIQNSFAVGSIDDTAILNNTAKQGYGGLTGWGGYFAYKIGSFLNLDGTYGKCAYATNYSLIMLKTKTYDNTDAISTSQYKQDSGGDLYDNKTGYAAYDENISLVQSAQVCRVEDTSIQFNFGYGILDSYNGKYSFYASFLNGKKTNLDHTAKGWQFSNINYPVQEWVLKNSTAKQVLGYNESGESNGNGTMFSPYVIKTTGDLKLLGSNENNYQYFILSCSPTIKETITLKSGVVLNGNGKTIKNNITQVTFDNDNLKTYETLMNNIISGLTITKSKAYSDTTYSPIFAQNCQNTILSNINMNIAQACKFNKSAVIGKISNCSINNFETYINEQSITITIGDNVFSSTFVRESDLSTINSSHVVFGTNKNGSVSDQAAYINLNASSNIAFGLIVGYAKQTFISNIGTLKNSGTWQPQVTIETSSTKSDSVSSYIGTIAGELLSNIKLKSITLYGSITVKFGAGFATAASAYLGGVAGYAYDVNTSRIASYISVSAVNLNNYTNINTKQDFGFRN